MGIGLVLECGEGKYGYSRVPGGQSACFWEGRDCMGFVGVCGGLWRFAACESRLEERVRWHYYGVAVAGEADVRQQTTVDSMFCCFGNRGKGLMLN